MAKRAIKARRARDLDATIIELHPKGRGRAQQQQHFEAARSKPLVCRTKAQTNYLQLLQSHTLIFGLGPAGTGKSYVAIKHACKLLEEHRIAKIVITRPVVEAEERLGALPGEIGDKFAPYFAPVREILVEHFGHSNVEGMMKSKRIITEPLAYMRGRTFNDAFVMLDEAQNVTPRQMKLFLTRIGQDSTVVVDGDLDQVDIPGPSGLHDALHRLRGMEGMAVQHFHEDDVVRSWLCKAVLQRYRSTQPSQEEA